MATIRKPQQYGLQADYGQAEAPAGSTYEPWADPNWQPEPGMSADANKPQENPLANFNPEPGGYTGGSAVLPGAASPGTASPTPGKYRGQLGGFDMGKLDAGKLDPKYVFAKHAQDYDVTDPAQRIALLEALNNDPSGFFKGSTWHGKDKIDVPGWNEGTNSLVDVIVGAGAGGQGWAWMPDEANPSGGGTPVENRNGGPLPGLPPLGSPTSTPRHPGSALPPGATPPPGYVEPPGYGEPGSPGNPARTPILDDPGIGGPGGPESPKGGNRETIDKILKQLLENGGNFDQALVDTRLSSARDRLNRFRSSQLDTDKAALAERGQIGSGGEAAALTSLDSDIAGQFGTALTDIYGNEQENADKRLIAALQSGTGLSIADAQNAIDKYNAETGRMGTEGNLDLGKQRLALDELLGKGRLDLDTILGKGGLDIDRARLDLDRQLGTGKLDLDRILGMGGLDLSKTGQQLDWNKFLGQLGLDRERLGFDMDRTNMDQLIQILQQLQNGATQSGGGYV